MNYEVFNKYEYQNLICEYDLSGLELRILIRLSNCYGKDGLIFPSNPRLAIWLGKISPELYLKHDKSIDEKTIIRKATNVIKNGICKLKRKKFIESEGNPRKFYLINPINGRRYTTCFTNDYSIFNDIFNKYDKKSIQKINTFEDIFDVMCKKLITVDKEELISMTYSDFLKTNYWLIIKNHVLKINNYKCIICNKTKNLNVHHKTYENHGFEHENLDDLILLCKSCHLKFHEKLTS